MLRTIALSGLALLGTIHVDAAVLADDAANIERCLSFAGKLSLGAPLPHTRKKLRADKPLTIVALGSSSTAGFGSSGRPFPEVMKAELSRLHPSLQINLFVSGRLVDTIGGSLARLDEDVLRYQPDLVIWQLGTDDVLWRGITADAKALVRNGVERLRKSNADVILMDLQYAPVVRAIPLHAVMERLIADVARKDSVAFFSRYALMEHAIQGGVDGLVSWDGLHNSAAGYRCVGRALARMIDQDALR